MHGTERIGDVGNVNDEINRFFAALLSGYGKGVVAIIAVKGLIIIRFTSKFCPSVRLIKLDFFTAQQVFGELDQLRMQRNQVHFDASIKRQSV